VRETAHFALVEKAGGTLNGSTWLDRTNYYETLPSHYLELGLWLEADRMGGLLPAMTQEKLDNQRDVVKNERRWRVDNQPYGDWDERIQAMVFPPEHPYHHSVIGSMEDLDAASLSDVEAFFRTYYTPNNAVLTLCGDFDPQGALALVERYFGPIPAGPPVPPIAGEAQLPLQLGVGPRQVVEQELSLARLFLASRIPAYGAAGHAPAIVASTILTSGKASLLYRTLVRERQLAQDVVSYAFPIVLSSSMMVLWATARPGVARRVLESAVLEQVGTLRSVATADVERAIGLIEAHRLMELEHVDERADQLSMNAMLFGDPGRINEELNELRAVSVDEVRDFATRYLGDDNRAVLWYVPKNGGQP
jgi:predicted Zn-dependent peptidase